MTGRATRVARLAAAALITISATLGVATLSSAAPSKQDLEAAKAKIDALNQHLSLLVEQYDQQRVHLTEIQAKLAEARQAAATARDAAEAAIAELNARASSAYQGMGSELEVLLGASSFSEFSDRLEFMGNLVQADSDLAAKADRAQQQAKWAGQQLQQAVQEQQRAMSDLRTKQDEIRKAIADAKAEYQALNRRYHDYLNSLTAFSPPTGGPPPAPNANAQAAIDAAYSVIGTPYVWGAADPSVGFDCSGLTMWSWAHAGVSLPHSSQMQYDSLPHVSRDQLQPGDLVFFYTPISHVGLYIGGSKMIDANHPGDVVNIRPVNWDSFSGAARP